MAQVIIFILGWPLEWSEIIIIFVPIFLPMLEHFNVDPMLFGILIAVNLQTSFLTPPMAMSAYYLKGVAPQQVALWTIFKGCFPFLGMVFLTLVLIYAQPKLINWLPDLMYNSASTAPQNEHATDGSEMDSAFLLDGGASNGDKPAEGSTAEPPADKPADEPAKEGAGVDPAFLGGGAKPAGGTGQ